mmetsp:Transcript_10856/g.22969  ORF Transcript_10856/g.22969 Transcript_10856/m.22969 type:complete len:94 (+) Transcript_10856:110-391(+)
MKSHHRKAVAAIVTTAKKEEDKKICAQIKCQSMSVEQMYRSLGSSHFRHAFQMEYDQFCLLHHKLDATMDEVMSQFYIRKGGRKGGTLFLHLY